MGIPTLLKVVEPFLVVINSANIHRFKGKTAGIDISCWLNPAIQSYDGNDEYIMARPTFRYIQYCVDRMVVLLSHGIRPIAVFDGDKLPAKSITHDKRRLLRQNAMEKIISEEGINGGVIDIKKRTRMSRVDFRAQSNMAKALREIGVEYVFAPYEADAQLAWMSMNGKVDFVITEDSDMTIYGCKEIAYKMSPSTLDNDRFVSNYSLDNDHTINNNARSFDNIEFKCFSRSSIQHAILSELVGKSNIDDDEPEYTLKVEEDSSANLKKRKRSAIVKVNPFTTPAFLSFMKNANYADIILRLFRLACVVGGCDYFIGIPTFGLKTALKSLFTFISENIEKVLEVIQLNNGIIPRDYYIHIIKSCLSKKFDDNGKYILPKSSAKKTVTITYDDNKTMEINTTETILRNCIAFKNDIKDIFTLGHTICTLDGIAIEIIVKDSVYDYQVVWNTDSMKMEYLSSEKVLTKWFISDNMFHFSDEIGVTEREGIKSEAENILHERRLDLYGGISPYKNEVGYFIMNGLVHPVSELFPTRSEFDHCYCDERCNMNMDEIERMKSIYVEKNGRRNEGIMRPRTIMSDNPSDNVENSFEEHMNIKHASQWYDDFYAFISKRGNDYISKLKSITGDTSSKIELQKQRLSEVSLSLDEIFDTSPEIFDEIEMSINGMIAAKKLKLNTQ